MSTPSDTSALHSKRVGYFVTGTIGVLLSIVYLYLSDETPFGTLDQPGPRVWPTIVGFMVLLGSAFTLWEAWRMPRDHTFVLPSGAGAKRVILLIALMVGYFLLMEPMGQLFSSILFCALMMRLISPMTWTRIIIASVSICVVMYVLFVVVLQIPMPKGPLGY